jgi:hypothetical protein
MAKQRLNKLTDVLSAIDSNDTKYLDKLTELQRKDLLGSLWLMMRYTSDVSGDFKASEIDTLHYLLMTNVLVNKNFMKVSEHPELQWKLLAHCGSGSKKYHSLLPPAGIKKINKKTKMLLEIFPESKIDEIDLITNIKSEEELKELCVEYGFDKKEIDSAFKR